MELVDRVDDLERRVTALEAEPVAVAPPSEDPLWALAALRDRLPEPGGVVLAGTAALPDGRRAEWQEGLTTDALLGQDWREAADLLAALGHPVRLAMVRCFLGGATTVADLTELDGLGSTGQAYHHLRQLVATGWLRSLGSGRYEVPVARVVPLLAVIMVAHP